VTQRLCQTSYCEFARCIRTLSGGRNDPKNTRNVNYVSLFLTTQCRQEALDPVHHTPEVNIHKPFNIVNRDLLDGPMQTHSRIVDDKGCSTVSTHYILGESGHLSSIADIDDVRSDFDLLSNCFGGFGETVRVDVSNRKRTTMSRKADRESTPDPTPGASNDGYGVFVYLHGTSEKGQTCLLKTATLFLHRR
jgi:hypothetical protein